MIYYKIINKWRFVLNFIAINLRTTNTVLPLTAGRFLHITALRKDYFTSHANNSPFSRFFTISFRAGLSRMPLPRNNILFRHKITA